MRNLLLGLLISLTACSCGCVQRRMTIRSNPPGALVFVDNQEIGTTPVATNFTYYGTRTIQLMKDGYETQTVKETFHAPWYQIPPLDFFSENLAFRENRDEHVVNFTLEPQKILPTEQLLDRAEQLRMGAYQGYAVSLPNASDGPEPIVPLPTPPAALPPPAGQP